MADSNKQADVWRVTVPGELQAFLASLAEDMGVSNRWAFRWLLRQFTDALAAGQCERMGPEIAAAWQRVQAAKAHAELARIDHRVLCRSPKLKSGYEGVYPYNRKWRSDVADPVRGVQVLGTYDTPQQAAWARHLYLKANKLPYGRLAARLAYFRKSEPEVVKMLDAEGLRRLAIYEAAKAGEPIEDLDEADRQWEREDPSNLSIPGQIVKLEA
jgi:hypothetical protein